MTPWTYRGISIHPMGANSMGLPRRRLTKKHREVTFPAGARPLPGCLIPQGNNQQMKATNEERAEALVKKKGLREWLKPGDTVHCILRHVSASGMSRTIDLIQITKTGEVRTLSYNAALACGWDMDTKREGVKIGGCGMDMGFHLVYSLGRKMFPTGFKLKKGAYGRNGDASGFDKDGGYALRHMWL